MNWMMTDREILLACDDSVLPLPEFNKRPLANAERLLRLLRDGEEDLAKEFSDLRLAKEALEDYVVLRRNHYFFLLIRDGRGPWKPLPGPEDVAAPGLDGRAWRWTIRHTATGEEKHVTVLGVSETQMTAVGDPATPRLQRAIASEGLSEIETILCVDDPPGEIHVS